MLVDETIEYNKSVCAGYNWQFKADNGTVVGQDTFKGLDPTISSQITRLSEAIRNDGVDHLMLCSTNPGAASSVRQLRAAGITLPIFSATAMDGTYWLNSTPGLKDFYLPSQALAVDDPRSGRRTRSRPPMPRSSASRRPPNTPTRSTPSWTSGPRR